jgi:hypothetical protein
VDPREFEHLPVAKELRDHIEKLLRGVIASL